MDIHLSPLTTRKCSQSKTHGNNKEGKLFDELSEDKWLIVTRKEQRYGSPRLPPKKKLDYSAYLLMMELPFAHN